ncbi:hypothetical protein M0805_005057 [Coniferiporia weirii]|nr:hypothetical protein M0805_005057 [Coniferiporia weirii]
MSEKKRSYADRSGSASQPVPRQSLLPSLSNLLDSVRSPNGHASSDSPLAHTLALLFETSPILLNVLVPEFSQRLCDIGQTDLPESHAQLIDHALQIVHGWGWSAKADFVGGHPRIGEVNGLSAMSAVEQGQTGQVSVGNAPAPTRPEVLARLAFLNNVYERRYLGLVYITFVNGRSRAQIRDEMEEKLSEEGVLPAIGEDCVLESIVPQNVCGDAWCKEVKRAVDDVGKIAKSRLCKLGYD